MKIKCYALYDETKQIFSEFSNNSQRGFLDYELKNALKRAKKSGRIQFQHTSNGVWYTKISQKTNKTHLVLLSKQYASISLASTIITAAQQLDQQKTLVQKSKMKISDLMKTTNANKKLDQVTSNVAQLQGIIKGNVGKLVSNMGDLQSVQRKSQMMSSLSLQFQKDSKALQQKMKRRNCITKMVIGGLSALVVIFLAYFFILP